MMAANKTHLLLLFIWPIAASLISFLIEANTFTSIILFLGIPSMYLSFISKRWVAKIAVFSIILGIPTAIIVDYIMEKTHGWFLPSSVFGTFRLFNYVTVEQLIWLFLYIYFVAIFYETFLDKNHLIALYPKKLKYLLIFLSFIAGLFGLLYFLTPEILTIDYFYLKFGILFGLVPLIFILYKAPGLYAKFIRVGAYFFYLSLIYELTALILGQWSFHEQRQFIGFVEIFGISFPFEEFFFWILLGSMATLSYYEYFSEDLK